MAVPPKLLGPSLAQVIRDYLEELRGMRRAPATLQSYGTKLAWLLGLLGDKPINTIDGSDLALVLSQLASGWPGQRPRSTTSVNQLHSTYLAFFRWAAHRGLVPGSQLRTPAPARAEASPVPAMPNDALVRLLATISQSNEPLSGRDLVAFALYASTGVRRNELLGVRVQDVDVDAFLLRIIDHKRNASFLRPMPESVARLVGRYICAGIPGRGIRPEEVLFAGRTWTMAMSGRAMDLRFRYWCSIASVPTEYSLHSLRAGLATRLYRATKDAIMVERVLGHRQRSTGSPYVQTSPEEIRIAVETAWRIIEKSLPRNWTHKKFTTAS